MNGRELFEAICAGECSERLPVFGIGAWGETRDRWHREGLQPDVEFNVELGLVNPDQLALPLNLNMVPAFPIRVLDREDDHVTVVDEYGVTKKLLAAEFDRTGGRIGSAGLANTMSHWIDFPVTDIASWKAIYAERFRPTLDGRWPEDWAARRAQFIEDSRTRWVRNFGFPLFGTFGPLRQLMGIEGLSYAMVDDPLLVRTIASDLAAFWVAAFDLALRQGVRLDQITFYEDMCGTRGPILSPAAFEEFFGPAYRSTIAALREMGVKQFFVDSDGHLDPMIPMLISCGITGILPVQASAGMDVGMLRERYRDLNLHGGIDKRALAEGPGAIDAELERVFTVAWRRGRMTPHLDHAAPPDISWANAQHYAERYVELCAAPPR